MGKIPLRLAAALGAAMVLVVVLTTVCASTQERPEVDAGVTVESQVHVTAADEWDMEAAVERARAEEAERLTVAPSPDPHIELENRMAEAITELQPWYRSRPNRARRLASIIHDAAVDHEQNPWIALAMAYKESSFQPGVGELHVTGDLGEEGYFQVMPGGYAMRTCGRGRSMGNARANADTAMCYLGVVQSECDTDDPWQYVSAYGMRRCPRPGEGRSLRPSKRARSILCRMVGEEECSSIWPA